MSDLISRQNAIDVWDKLSKRGRTEFDQVLMTLPSAESKTGKWIHGSYIGGPEYRRCNQCFAEIEESIFGFEYDVNYCPNCGCRMEEDKNDKG